MLSRQSSFVTSAVIASRYIPVWIATIVLVLVAAAIAPGALSAVSFSSVLPFTAFLAIVSLGQMLVIMTGGIDLSVPSVMTLTALVVVGTAAGSDGRAAQGVLTGLAVAGLIGLINGLIIGVLKLNPVIVTLAVGQVVRGFTISYSAQIGNTLSMPDVLGDWATSRFAGISWTFWVGVVVMIVLALVLRYTIGGRRFQSVGANPTAAWISGVRVNGYVIFAYTGAALLYGLGAILLAAFIRSPNLTLGDPYLLAPIAVVVIGGASLTGGLASTISTCVAAFFLTLLNQLLRALGLSSALQFVAFGIAIVGGMIVSGDRIITVIEGVFRGVTAPKKGGDAENAGFEAAHKE